MSAPAGRRGLVRLERPGDGVAVLTLADPERRNAIGPAMAEALAAAIRRVAAGGGVRAVVVAGDGPAFCAGADLPAVFGPAREVPEMRAFLSEYYRSFLAITELEMPTIAAVHGPAVGAGLNLALACDIRLAGPDAAFGATFTRLGLHPGGGCSAFLVRAAGRQRALRILLEGRTLDAAAAAGSGLIDEVVDDPRAAALELAGRIAALEPGLAADIKRSVTIAAEHGLGPSLAFEAWAQAATAGGQRVRAAVDRFAGAGR